MKDIEFTYKDSLINQDKINETSNELIDYVEHLSSVTDISGNGGIKYEESESSINLPFDVELHGKVSEVVERVCTDNLKYIIVIGIGGSNLGTRAIYESLRGQLDSFLVDKLPKIIFLDTVNPTFFEEVCNIINKNIISSDEILLNVISKSGATTETIVNFETIYSFLSKKFKDIKNRIVVTTDIGSMLYKEAQKNNIEILGIPKIVGGRYSVFSSVGLFPLALAGFDVAGVLAGAKSMRNRCIEKDISKNPAMVSAILVYLHSKRGVSIHNSFFFNPEFEQVGKWYRQLMGESIGKKFNVNNDEVNIGVTPIVSIGSTDLHSMAQLYFGGPKDKFTTFIYAQKKDTDVSAPKETFFNNLVAGIEEKKFSKILDAILGGVKESYRKNKLPFVEVQIPEVNEHALGQFLQFKMIEMMYLGRLFGVDAFNQPDVEDYKKETRKILSV